MPDDGLEPVEKSKARIEIKGKTRDLVFGMQDGLISILGLVAGVYGAYADHGLVVVITGVTGAIAAAISMAVGSLLSSEAERDLLIAEIEEARKLFEEKPYLAQESLLHKFIDAGLDKPSAYTAVKTLSQNEDVLFDNFRNSILDLPAVEKENPYINATVMFFAFILGSLFPILPFIFLTGQTAYYTALISTGSALFTLGTLKGYFANENALKSGLKFFIIAVIAGVSSEFAGTVVGDLLTSFLA